MSDLKENMHNAKSYFLENVVTTGYCFKVIDGDTIKCVIKHKDEYLKITVRLCGIDTDEKKNKSIASIAATEFTKKIVLDKNVKLIFKSLDKYGRHLCDVFQINDINGAGLSRQLLDAKLAKEYNGGKKETFSA